MKGCTAIQKTEALRTLSIHPKTCTPKQRPVQSKSNLRDYLAVSAMSPHNRDVPGRASYGPMITLAPATGNVAAGSSSADIGPMHCTGASTADNQLSSCEDSCDLDEVYQEPAWLASRMDIALTRVWEIVGLLYEHETACEVVVQSGGLGLEPFWGRRR